VSPCREVYSEKFEHKSYSEKPFENELINGELTKVCKKSKGKNPHNKPERELDII
jgi:hypothetical protein